MATYANHFVSQNLEDAKAKAQELGKNVFTASAGGIDYHAVADEQHEAKAYLWNAWIAEEMITSPKKVFDGKKAQAAATLAVKERELAELKAKLAAMEAAHAQGNGTPVTQ